MVHTKALTKKEIEALLVIFKDYSVSYNAHSISARMDITPRGALKVLKSLRSRGLLTGRTLGKATFYKTNFDDAYAVKTIETLLMQEARECASLWVSEFKELFQAAEIAILFGSIIRSPKNAKDVDLLLVLAENSFGSAKRLIEDKNKVLLKPIHPIYQSADDIKNSLKRRDPVIVNALRRGYVLHGYDKLVGILEYATTL